MARLAVAAAVLAIGPMLAACDSLETFELFDTKKKLAGERKPVFPDGVPGVTSGIPADLVKGHHEYEHADITDPAKVAAEAAASTPTRPKAVKPQPAPKPATTSANPLPKRTAKPPAQQQQQSPGATTTAAAPPAPPPPGQPGAAPLPWPGAAQPQAAWPGSAPSGTVTR